MSRAESSFKKFRRRLRTSWGNDISTPKARRSAVWHYHLFDHAFFRTFWTNFAEIAPGVYRANHPSPKRLEKYKAMGITHILNLRGADPFSPWLLEEEACKKLGIDLRTAQIYPRRPATSEEILTLIATLKSMPKPFLMHCKSGADRAGFAAALYLAVVEKVPMVEAKKQLSARFLHFRFTVTGVLDHILDMYDIRNAQSPIDIETWFAREYSAQDAQASFDALRGTA